jgi:O-antigen ligase
MLLSRSTTALAATVVGVGMLGLGLGLPPDWRRRWLPGLVMLLAGMLLVYALMLVQLLPGLGTLMAPLAALTDKDSTMTGRTEIWNILFDHIAQRPLLGSGYGAYWTPEPSAAAESWAFAERMGGFYPGSAHNGYLEIVNDLGWVGLSALMVYLAAHVRLCLRLLPLAPVQAVLYLALFFQQLVANLSETHWFSVLSVDFVLMTLLSAALARSLLEHDLRANFGVPPASEGPLPRRVAVAPRASAPGWAGEAV